MENYELRLAEVDQRAKSNTKRIDRLEERQDDLEKLTEAITTVQVEQKHIVSDVGEIKDDIKDMKERPRKHWDIVIAAAIGAMVGFIMKTLGVF